MTTGKTIALTIESFVGKMISLLFYTQFRFVIAFLPGSNHLLISCLQSPSTVILELKKFCYCFHLSHFYLPWSDGTRCLDLIFLILSSKLAFSLSSFTLINPHSNPVKQILLEIESYWCLKTCINSRVMIQIDSYSIILVHWYILEENIFL